jgi:probable addiction module antidote protein
MPIKAGRQDVQEQSTTEERQINHLQEAFADGDPALIAAVLGDVARANDLAKVAKEAGVTEEALHKSLRFSGDPRLSTLMGVLKALGLELQVSAAAPRQRHEKDD